MDVALLEEMRSIQECFRGMELAQRLGVDIGYVSD